MSRKSRMLSVLVKPPLLRGESIDDFYDLRDMIERDIVPMGVIEAVYVADITCIIWDILRLRRCKAAAINTAYLRALRTLLMELSVRPDQVIRSRIGNEISDEEKEELKIADLALRWFTDDDAKLEVSRLLGRFQLDESAIETRAIRNMSSQLEWLDKMMMSLEIRRDRALRQVAKYRESLARRLRESTQKIVDAQCDDRPRLQNGVPFEVFESAHHDE